MEATAAHVAAPERALSLPKVLWRTVVRWTDSDMPGQSAALAFYTLFSLAPVLMVAVAIAGPIFGAEATRTQLEQEVSAQIGQQAARIVHQVLMSAADPKVSGVAEVIGLVSMFLGATALFLQLQAALNSIWEVEPKPGHLVRHFLQKRLVSFGLMLMVGFLLIVSLVVSAGVSAATLNLSHYVSVPPWVVEAADFGAFFVLLAVVFGLIYRILPDARIAWRDVAAGAVATALVFSLGKYLIAFYLGKTATTSVYGAAGSLVIVLLWVYYSSMILLLGAVFTRVWSRRHRPRGVVPEPGARHKPAKA